MSDWLFFSPSTVNGEAPVSNSKVKTPSDHQSTDCNGEAGDLHNRLKLSVSTGFQSSVVTFRGWFPDGKCCTKIKNSHLPPGASGSVHWAVSDSCMINTLDLAARTGPRTRSTCAYYSETEF